MGKYPSQDLCLQRPIEPAIYRGEHSVSNCGVSGDYRLLRMTYILVFLSYSREGENINHLILLSNFTYYDCKHKNATFCPQCIYAFCVDLISNSDYFTIQH